MAYVPNNAKFVAPCAYCGYSVGYGELCIQVERWLYHVECAETLPNIEIDWVMFDFLVQTGEIKIDR